MTKGHGFFQRRIDADFKPEDILWIEICESVKGKPFEAILSAEKEHVKKLPKMTVATDVSVGDGDEG